MSFEKNDPRLTAYVLDEADPDEHAAMENVINADPELREAVNELFSASQTIANVLGMKASENDELQQAQRAKIDARANRLGARRRLWIRRRFAYAGLAAAFMLLVCTILLAEYIERSGPRWYVLSRIWSPESGKLVGWEAKEPGAAEAIEAASTSADVSRLSLGKESTTVVPAANEHDAPGNLDEFEVFTGGGSASKQSDGLSSDTQALVSKRSLLERPGLKGQTVPVTGERRYDFYYGTGATPLGVHGGGGFGGQGASGGPAGYGGGGFGGVSTSGGGVGGDGGIAGTRVNVWSDTDPGTQTLGTEQLSQLQSLGYVTSGQAPESSTRGRTFRGYALVDADGDGINESINLYVQAPETVSGFAWQDMNAQRESYAPIVENVFVQVSQQPLSTFGLDVDTASYANVRRFLNNGQLPPPDAVRIEEFVNAFDYEYAAPAWDGHSVAVHGEIAGCPWNPLHRLALIAVKAKEVPFDVQPPLRLTFLIDVSGSMKDNNKLPLLRESMKALTRKLRPTDQIAIVTYNNTAQRVMGPTPCSSADSICATIDSLCADGSTNGAGGIELAYAAAKEQFYEEGLNRVILATDGDFNVGETENAALVQRIQEHAKSGVFLTVLGFGVDNLKDDRLEGLANKGNGNYYYIDSFAEANKVLVDRMAGTIAVAAKDAKIQVEFNPAKVGAYRLLGYENRALAAQDFNDDRKDAGDLGAGHTVTALYELVPVGVSVGGPGVDPLKYQYVPRAQYVPQDQLTPESYADDNPETMTIKLRYKEPNASESKRIEVAITDTGTTFEAESGDFRLASAAAMFAMLLRNSQYAGNATFESVQRIAEQSANGAADRTEFVSLVVAAKTLRTGR